MERKDELNWEHKCDLGWLRQRQQFITASDIKRLIPFTKTGRPRVVNDATRLNVMAGKMINLTEEDCMSYGAAARGHILEPYAIAAANDMLLDLTRRKNVLKWWDDEMVCFLDRSLAFSPDALDVPMDGDFTKARVIGEVKCYTPEQHLAVAYTEKDKIEERWQIATAMAVLPSLDTGYLILYNPRMKERKVFLIEWDRDELSKEIDTILQVEKDWDEFVENGPLHHNLPNNGCWANIGLSEDALIHVIEKKKGVNPVI